MLETSAKKFNYSDRRLLFAIFWEELEECVTRKADMPLQFFKHDFPLLPWNIYLHQKWLQMGISLDV